MEYDPIKDKLGALFGKSPTLQKVFFKLLGAVFLRNWYVRKALREELAMRDADKPRDATADQLRVLDAGSGFGQHAYWIAHRFPGTKISAVDVKSDYLDKARDFIASQGLGERVTFSEDDLTDLRAVGPFDLILSVDVMEHIEDDRGVFRHFERVLRPGGTVIINTPSDQGGSGVQADADESFIGEHVRDGYPMDELKAKLSEAGLEPYDATYTYGRWGGIGWRLLVKYPMQLLGHTFAWFVLLPVYYAIAFPLGMLLNALDVVSPKPTGTGLIVRARKPGS